MLETISNIINYPLFTLGAKDFPVLLIDLVTSIAGLTCVFLAGRASKANFWVGYLYTTLLFLMFWNKNLYASLLLQPISLGINILGHYRWSHPKAGEGSSTDRKTLRVTMLSWKQRILALVSVLVLALLWGHLLWMLGHHWAVGVFSPDPVPYLDSCVTMLILVAQFLSALKKWDCWVAWLLVNITQLMLHISVGHVFMPIVSFFYLVNGIISIYKWGKMYKEKK